MFDRIVNFLTFASDATELAIAGAALLLISILALVADRRQLKRKRIDAVGCMPWTALFLIAAICGVSLLTLAVKGWAAG
jgi:hypothetical protein